MLAVALRGLVAHKVRVLLSALSIALGVAFVSGTLVLSDSMNTSLTAAYTDQYDGTDVVVRAPSAVEDSEAIDQRRPIPAALLHSVTNTPGVETAEGKVTGFAMVVDKSGNAITRDGAATQGTSAPTVAALAGQTETRSGRMPQNPRELAVDANTADSAGFALGDRVRVVFRTGSRPFTLVGTVGFGGNDSFAGNSTAFFDTATAQRVLGKVGKFDEIRVAGTDGVNAEQLQKVMSRSLPTGIEATTGAAAADQAAKVVKDNLQIVNVILMVFAAIAVFVGSFIIWNTFSIIVAQRTRELALLRAVGATRRQVQRSVIVEALAIGTAASIIGIGLGVALASGLKWLLGVFGMTLPPASPELRPRTIIVSLMVGVLVTVAASLAPSRRATRIAPVAALRDIVPAESKFSHRRLITSGVVLVIGLLALAAGLSGGGNIALVGLGVAVTFIAVTMLFPLFARPAARFIGAPMVKLGGSAGLLARDNAMRNPRRTASTAAALMIGLSVVAAIAVVGASLKATINSDVDRTARAELILTTNQNTPTISPAAADVLRKQPGVAAVSEFGYGAAQIEGARHYVTPVDPATVNAVLDLGVNSGKLSELTDKHVFVYDKTAEENNWKIGDTLNFLWPQAGHQKLAIAGTYSERGAVGSEYLVPFSTYDKQVAQRLDSLILVKLASGTPIESAKAGMTAALRAYPNIQVRDVGEFKAYFGKQVDKILALAIVLLALAIVIALLGIVNTLALSVFERTRELGLLRAVGMTRPQVRAMVRFESVIISVLGALLGVIVGVGFGLALTKALESEGFHTIRVPWLQILVFVVLAGVAGILAAIGPARSAAKVDVLRAVVTE